MKAKGKDRGIFSAERRCGAAEQTRGAKSGVEQKNKKN